MKTFVPPRARDTFKARRESSEGISGLCRRFGQRARPLRSV
jgi:hypothetical protein